MTATIVTVSLTLALNSFGLGHEPDHHHPHHIKEDHILSPGPGLGWGFPNDNPDNYGWTDYGVDLPLGATARPSITSPDTSLFLPNRCSSRRTTTHSRREVSGIFPLWVRAATIPRGDRRRDRVRCR